MGGGDFEAVVEAIELENEETRRVNAVLRELIEDTQNVNKVLENVIKAEVSRDKKTGFIKEMLR